MVVEWAVVMVLAPAAAVLICTADLRTRTALSSALRRGQLVRWRTCRPASAGALSQTRGVRTSQVEEPREVVARTPSQSVPPRLLHHLRVIGIGKASAQPPPALICGPPPPHWVRGAAAF